MQKCSQKRSFLNRVKEYPGHLKNWYIWKTGFCRRLRQHDPILVHQMGKVGSRSIQEPLQRSYPGEVIHAHVFSDDYPQGEVKELYRYWNSRKPPCHIHLISLTRNPVDRNVSAFFQNFEHYTGTKPEDNTRSMPELRDCFLEVFDHETPLRWFQDQFFPKFGIDVFKTPFPQEGFLILPHNRTPALILKLETPDDLKNQAIRQFLNLPDFRLERKNDSSRKDYGKIYKEFKEKIPLPEAYVQKMVRSQYFQHFYTPEDADSTFARWCR